MVPDNQSCTGKARGRSNKHRESANLKQRLLGAAIQVCED